MRRADILGVILAGGQSRRYGEDKARASLGCAPLIEQVLIRAAPQAGAMAVSGREYGLGIPVIPDAVASEGPLSGVISALDWAKAKGFCAIATFSCDAPFFPRDLVATLGSRAMGHVCCYARSRSGRHPVFALWRTQASGGLHRFHADGVRALRIAQDRLDGQAVLFPDGAAPDGDMFFNINRRADQAFAQSWLENGVGAAVAREPLCKGGVP